MGRPSKKEQRTEEILDAFYRCVARYGLEGSTLEFIATEASLKRSLVRHYVGNRESLVDQLVDRVLTYSSVHWEAFLENVPSVDESQGSQEVFIEYILEGLFSEQHSDAEYILVIESLIFSANHNPVLRKKMQQWLQRFTDDIGRILGEVFSDKTELDIKAVAFGVISIYFNLDSLSPLGMNHIYRKPAHNAARLLIHSLK
jgi:AcrR family transcriptional regulator